MRADIPKSAIAKKMEINITVATTTIVYLTSSLRLGQDTRFISVETSLKNFADFFIALAKSCTPIFGLIGSISFRHAQYAFRRCCRIFLYEVGSSDLALFYSLYNCVIYTLHMQVSLSETSPCSFFTVRSNIHTFKTYHSACTCVNHCLPSSL